MDAPWLDVHILLSPRTATTWVAQCRASVKIASAQAGFPVAIHYLDALDGHIGHARHRGYSLGRAPYVTHVDDDDYVLPEAFAQLRPALAVRADAIFTPEWHCHCRFLGNGVIKEHLQTGWARHSLKVFRREHLIDFRPWRWAGDPAQAAYLTTLTHLIDLPTPTYIWRVYPTSLSTSLRLAYPHELVQARSEIPRLLAAS